jgi:hypothetical protein
MMAGPDSEEIGMSFEKLAEAKIRAAQEAGEFDNLRGKGKPLDLGPYFATPADLRLGYSVLKSAHVLPPEVELLREIESLTARLATCVAEEETRRLTKAIEGRRLKLALFQEGNRRRGRRSR